MADLIREALERAAQELDLAGHVLLTNGFSSTGRRMCNEAHVARTALAAEPPAPAEPVATLHVSDFRGYENYDFQQLVDLPPGHYKLFTTCTAQPPAPDPREALAARPLLEAVARMGDRIGPNTVGEIAAISDRAAAWLAENPPGQPVAIEPRGCPTPGACSCVEPPAPVPVADGASSPTPEEIALLWDASNSPSVFAGLVLARWGSQPHAPVPVADGEREELAQWLERIGDDYDDLYRSPSALIRPKLARAAALLRHADRTTMRLHRLQQEDRRFREPERTILCDLLANGTLLPDPDGQWYGVPSSSPADGEREELAQWLDGEARSCAAQFHDRITRAAALLRQPAPAPVPGWQPMDTAPQDGTEILASDYDAHEIVSWSWDAWETGSGWVDRNGQRLSPTWWQPLLDHPPIPQPPQANTTHPTPTEPPTDD